MMVVRNGYERWRTMDYVVDKNDTLERIAASHDCTVGELVKLNKMASRMVFPGQHLIVPAVSADDVFEENEFRSAQQPPPMPSTNSQVDAHNKIHHRVFSHKETCTDGIRKGPGVSAPIQLVEQQSNDSNSHAKLKQAQKSMEFDLADAECLQRFLKIKVKQVTESDGTVTGTLLVTPNCLMFDPELSHPLVKENGTDLYGMVANMEDVVSVSVYKHIEDLTGEEKKTDGIYDPNHVSKYSPREKPEATRSALNSSNSESISNPRTPPVFGLELSNTPDGMSSQDNILRNSAPTIPPRTGTTPPLHAAASLSSNASESQLPSIKEEDKGTPTTPGANVDVNSQLQVASAKRRTVSDLTSDQKTPIEEVIGPTSATNKTDRQRCHSDLEASTSVDNSGSETLRSGRFHASFSRYSPDVARRSFGRLGRTLSARANSIKGTVQSGAQTVASGTQKVAHGVVTHTKSAADQIQTGIQASAKMVASVPGSIVNVGSGLLQEGQSSMSELFSLSTEEPAEISPKSMKREKSLAKLESLREKTKQAREQQASMPMKDMRHSDSIDEHGAKDANVATNVSGTVIGTPPSPPYYLTVRLDRKKRKKHRIQDEDDARELCATLSSDYGSKGVAGFGNTRKREFWFAVPRSRVDAIYHFLLQWSPDKYGQDIKDVVGATSCNDNHNASGDSSEDLKAPRSQKNQKTREDDRGFIVLDSDVDDYLACAKPKIPFGSHNINREWEIVTVKELCRRLSLDDALEPGEMPLPQGSKDSQILDEYMINQIVDILPPRAEGYPWVQVYNSEKHGFSLATMYRKMGEWKDEMSPILLLIRDVDGHVFGAVSSSALLPKECYYGTGDSSLLFRFTGQYPHTRELRSYTWTGDNQFFTNATKEFLSLGAGGGHYGLYLDADLNFGRSQRCATFNNEPLAGGVKEDFQIQFVEAFGFSMQ